MKFRRKETTVDAYQYTGPDVIPADGNRPSLPGVVWIRVSKDDDRWYPHTVTVAGRYAPLKRLDWVVRDVSGVGYYAVEPDSFDRLYVRD